jgi:hypothetical protein
MCYIIIQVLMLQLCVCSFSSRMLLQRSLLCTSGDVNSVRTVEELQSGAWVAHDKRYVGQSVHS